MTPRFKFYFDDLLVNEPVEIAAKYITTVQRDYELNAKRSYIQLSNATATTANNDTFYFGNFFADVIETNARRRYIPLTAAGTIKEVAMAIYATTAGTTVLTFKIDVRAAGGSVSTTTLGSQALTVSAGINYISYTGLSIAVLATDAIQMHFITANSGTAPTGVRPTATVGIE
jgi:hypothetical protein